ncbi:MAG: hypothetical protein JWP89_3504 [Schlesneria sp.]|nr:hypothetical protein [Schlesneria sp.]
MKYMLLIYSNENSWTESEREACFEESTQVSHELMAAGKFLAASPLQPISVATTLRIRDGKRLISDGPFAETHEQLGGYFLIEATDLDDAISIADRLPAAKKGTIEIRPILELPNLPYAS